MANGDNPESSCTSCTAGPMVPQMMPARDTSNRPARIEANLTPLRRAVTN